MSHLKPSTERAMALHAAWMAKDFGSRELALLSASDIVALSETLEAVQVTEGTRLLSPGEPADAAYVVERGEVALFVRRGTRRALISIQGPGGVFGDVPLLCDMLFPFTAVARTDAVLLKVPREKLTQLLATHPKIALRWLTSVVKRLERAHRRVVALTVGDLRARVLALLADGMGSHGGSVRRLRLTQAEMASLLGARRQSVNRVLGRLATEGLIRQQYGELEIVDQGRIAELAGSRAVAGAC